MGACTIAPNDRRDQVKRVGEDLDRYYGKKPYYTVQEVKDANRRRDISPDFCCWSFATFNTRSDFDTYHQSIGEQCDYSAMKTDMLSSVSSTSDTTFFDIDLSWIEFPDIDWDVFDFIDIF